MTTPASAPTPVDPRDVLNKLRSEHLDKVKSLNELKERQFELQTQMLAAQDAVFKSYQAFATTSEQFLVGVVDKQAAQLKAAQAQAVPQVPAPVPQVPAQASPLPTIPEAREDNLQQQTQQ